MKINAPFAVVCAVALAIQGCATASKDITATYISPLQYQSYDCDQIAAEVVRIQVRVVQLGGRLDQAASNDAGIMAVGLLIFWPVLFALGGTKQQEAEYARLKGEYDALEQQAIIKKCRSAIPQTQPAAVKTTAEVAVAPLSTQAVVLNTAPAPLPTSTPSEGMMPVALEKPSAVPVSVSTSLAVPLKGESKYMFVAEKFAKTAGCNAPIAAMNIRSSVSETFTIACAAGDPMSIRCDEGLCRELK